MPAAPTDPRPAEALDRECRTFCAYLVGDAAPPEAVVRAYREAHAAIPYRHGGATTDAGTDAGLDPTDRAILDLARRGGLRTRAADAYARFARPGGVLRQKLVLLLAILESAPPHHERVNRASGRGVAGGLAALAAAGLGFAAALTVGIVLLGPRHLAARGGGVAAGGAAPGEGAP